MRKQQYILGILAAVVCIALAIVAIPFMGGNSSSAKTTSPSPTASASQSTSDLATLFTVTTVTEKCVPATGADVPGFDIPSTKAPQPKGPRVNTDDISTPFTGNLDDVEQAICKDPLLGATVANMLTTISIDGTSLTALNPWLTPFAGDAKGINDAAMKYVTLIDVSKPTKAQRSVQEKLDQQWVEQAELIDTLLTRFKTAGVQSPTSVRNWHLDGDGIAVNKGKLPEVSLDPNQDSKPALILTVQVKNCANPLIQIGFNLEDKRPEVFTAKQADCQQVSVPKVAKPTTPSSPKTTPPPKGCASTAGLRKGQPGWTYDASNCSWKYTPPPPPKTCTSVYGPGHAGSYPDCPKDGTTAPQPPTSGPQGPNPSNSADPNDTYVDPNGGNTEGPGGSSQCKDPKTGYAVPCGTTGAYDPNTGGFLD